VVAKTGPQRHTEDKRDSERQNGRAHLDKDQKDALKQAKQEAKAEQRQAPAKPERTAEPEKTPPGQAKQDEPVVAKDKPDPAKDQGKAHQKDDDSG
jgi:hypothetical protein